LSTRTGSFCGWRRKAACSYNPKEYLENLRVGFGESFYVVVEKILSAHESLRESWPVDGTTGYEFCAQLTALLVDASAEPALTRFYREFTDETQPFSEIVRKSKIKIMENELESELEALARDAVRVARLDLRTTDFTRHILRRALLQIIACFPVYRTYVDESGPQEEDKRYIHWAAAQASRNAEEVDRSVFEFLEGLLTGRPAGGGFRSAPGAIKLELIRMLLAFRREHSEVFERGNYEALQISDQGAPRVCAFLRTTEGGRFLAIASLDAQAGAGDYPRARLRLGSQEDVTRWRDVITERTISGDSKGVDLANVFSVVPVALLIPVASRWSEESPQG
jgi:maltooligosyltrehalose synthase